MKRMLLALLAVLLAWPHPAYAAGPFTSIEQLNQNGITIGTDTGNVAQIAVEQQLPNATIVYFNDSFTGYEAVAQGKVDAFAYDRRQMELAIKNGRSDVRLLDENFDRKTKICVGISSVSQIDDLEGKINRFIAELRADGTLDDMFQRWVLDENYAMPVLNVPQEAPIHLMVGTSGIVPPYSFYEGEGLTGYDIELARRFAVWLGASLEFEVYDYESIIQAAESGKIDCIMANLQADDERRSAFTFSDPLYEENVALMVRDDGQGAGSSFFDKLAQSFNKTFVREDRWRLFVEGVVNTLLITASSMVLGTVLGFALFMRCRNGSRLMLAVTDACLWVVRGMPVVVLLMLLAYVVFAKLSISGTAIAVIGFTLTFGCTVFALLETGVGAVGGGQYEAARALGYNDRQAFFRVVLPQAVPHMTAAFRAEATGLLKATSVVGYVTVQDLTRMGDIVRSRTYEAFFPLIAVTVIYFVLEGLIDLALGWLETRQDPRKRTPESILKGVEAHD